MMVKVFTLNFDPALGAFDDGEVREFLKDRRLLSLENHFFTFEHTPYLCLVAIYEPDRSGPSSQPQSKDKKRDESWKKLLTPESMPLFNTLRDWRMKISRKEGIPPYVVCTNYQLAVMVKDRPQSKTALGRIEGFGSKKVVKYADELLGLLKVEPEEQVEAGGDLDQAGDEPAPNPDADNRPGDADEQEPT